MRACSALTLHRATPTAALTPHPSMRQTLFYISNEPLGPFNLPLTLRAVMNDERGLPVQNEMPIELVP